MTNLRVRCRAALVFLAVASLAGCTALTSMQRSQTSGGLVVSNLNLDFGPVVVGSSKVVAESIFNATPSSVTISATVSGPGFGLDGVSLPLTVPGNQSATLGVRFVPQNSGNPLGSLTISSSDSAPITVALAGEPVTPGQLTVTPSPVSFGNVILGNSSTQSATVTNSGGSDVTISQATATSSEFQLSGMSLPFVLPASQSANFAVTFTPKSGGNQSGMISLTASSSLVASRRRRKSNPSVMTNVSFQTNLPSPLPQDSGSSPQTVNIPVIGVGSLPGQLSLSSASISFGNVQVGSSQTLSETVTNSGNTSVNIGQVTVTGSGFSSGASTLPLSLAPGQSQTFSIIFAPTVAGSAAGNVSILSDASNPSLNAAISGSGVGLSSLTANPSSLNFGNVLMGSTQTLSQTLTNSGSGTITISQVNAAGGYTLGGLSLPATLTPGQSTGFTVTFTPSAAGPATGNVTIISTASNPTLTVPLSGTGITLGSLTASASSLNFGSVQVGSSQTLNETLTNSGGSSVTINNVTATGPYSLSALSLPATLTPGQSTSFTVTFTPATGGPASGALSVNSTASNPTLALPLSGNGITPGSLTASASSLSFGSVQVGTSQILTETLTNSGGSSVTINNVTATGPYGLSALNLPATLSAGQSTSFTLTFTPVASGPASGNVTITSTASNPTLAVPLSGTGITPGSLTASASSLSFGSVQVGTSQILTETLTNSGGSSVTVNNVTASGPYGLSALNLPATLSAGQSTSFTLTFTPVAGGPASGNVTITSTASNPTLTVPLSGTGITPGSLTATAASLSFGSVQVGSSQTLSETLTNTGGSSVTINQATAPSGYSLSGLAMPATLPPGQSASFTVTFTPTAGGPASGNLSITSTASNPTLTVPLSGTGIAPGSLTATAANLSFGSVQVGSSQTLSETLTNSGGASLTISQVTTTAPYTLSGLTLPATLTPGQSANLTVTFTPAAGGPASSSLSISSTASNPTVTIPLSGTGVTPGSLAASAASLSFGSVQVGSTQTLTETLTNSGGVAVTINGATATGAYSLSGPNMPATLNPGQTSTLTVKFIPTSTGPASGNLSITSTASNPTLTIPLSGTGITPASLTASATSLSFGSVPVNSSQRISETLTNSGGSNLTITQANATGPGFSVTGLNLPMTLLPGQSFTCGIIFAPAAAGAANGNVAFISNASNPNLAVALSGNAVAAGSLTINPATLSFGSVIVKQSKSMPAKLSATGSSVTISSAGAGTSEFALSGQTFPLTIAAGNSATITVTFTPQASGAASDTVSFSSDASNQVVENLTGSGAAPPQHSVDLTWTASSSSVNGYNIYRSGTSGGPYSQINSSLDSSTSFIDNTVVAGNTYYYVTTAVDANNAESVNSNQVKAVIPTP